MMSEPEISTSTSNLSRVIDLRQKLSSVAWVQCDNTNCMKWRRVDKAIADELTGDTWWECSMNQDSRFNACNIPEEDVESFDNLAKKAKLVVFKSELTPGSLVWGKMSGYCNWPALVTEDPANGEYWYGEEDEPEKGYYHVEFLGKQHCHFWVYTKSVELFGEGNLTLVSHQSKNSRKRKRGKPLCHQMTQKKKTVYGGGSVDKAIEEALKLLPLSHEERLKHSRFVKENQYSEVKSKADDVELDKIEGKSKNLVKRNKSTKTGITCKQLVDSNSKIKRRRSRRLNSDLSENDDANNTESNAYDQYFSVSANRQSKLSFDFLTSLIGISKEERLFLDISTYKEKKHIFHESFRNFYAQYGLPEPTSSPVWHNTKINYFDLFLAVDDRGGFAEVSTCHHWSHVYLELTNYPSKEGARKAKVFYKKYLYPYELYIKDEDFSVALMYLKSCTKHNQHQSNKKCDALETEESDMDNDEFVQALDELDDLLQTLNGKDGVVPDLYNNESRIQLCCDEEIPGAWDALNIPEKKHHRSPITGSQPTAAVEPKESAQVVPELDFPSVSSESSSHSEDDMQQEIEDAPQFEQNDENDWILHELQALEHHL